jgi:hypothetical protein
MGASANDRIAACGESGVMDDITATDCLLRTFELGGSRAVVGNYATDRCWASAHVSS